MFRKLLLILLLSIISIHLLSCEENDELIEEYLESNFGQIDIAITNYTNEIFWNQPFTFIAENINTSDNVYTSSNYEKIIIMNNPKTQVLAYYTYSYNNYLYTHEAIGFIQYNEELNAFIAPNTYTKTYRILEGDNLVDILNERFYNNEAGSYLKSEIYKLFSYIDKRKIICTRNSNSTKFNFNEIQDEYNIKCTINLESKNFELYFEKVDVSNNEIIKIRSIDLNDNNLEPIELDGYILHPGD